MRAVAILAVVLSMVLGLVADAHAPDPRFLDLESARRETITGIALLVMVLAAWALWRPARTRRKIREWWDRE